jgi:hypothetical protein
MLRTMDKEVEIKKIEEESMENSWKDELVVIVFSLPIVLNFLSPIFSESTMGQAWENLAKAPEWYTTILGVLFLVIFGLRNLVYKLADKLFDTKSGGKCNCK